jgi:hypothetical protein
VNVCPGVTLTIAGNLIISVGASLDMSTCTEINIAGAFLNYSKVEYIGHPAGNCLITVAGSVGFTQPLSDDSEVYFWTAGSIGGSLGAAQFGNYVNPLCNGFALPVELMYFTSNCVDENPILTWATSTELNNDYFTIERSRDGLIFETMENIDALGTGTTTQHYSWMDSNPLDGTSYYRLSQTDFNGTTELFETVSVNCGKEKTIFYPNPFNNEFTLVSKFGGTLTLFDSAGKLIVEQFFIGGKNSIQMGQINSGVYTAFVTLNNGKHEIHKLIKL